MSILSKKAFKTLTYLCIMLMCLGVAVKIQYGQLKEVAFSTVFFDKWVFNGRSSEVLKKMSLGYDIVLADYLWLRSIQSFGGRGMSSRDWKPVYYQYDTLTDIDPQMEHAYTFGNMVIGDEGRQQGAGLDLIEKGMRYNPHPERESKESVYENGYKGTLYRYRVPFEGMYISNWTLSDKQRARFYGRVAETALNAPDWISRMVAYLDVSDGEYIVGVDRYLGNLLQGLEAGQDYLVSIAVDRLANAIDKWNCSLLKKAVAEYVEENERNPKNIADLSGTNVLKNYEMISFSKTIALIETIRKKQGQDGISMDVLAGFAVPNAADFSWADSQIDKLGVSAETKLLKIQNEIFKTLIGKQSGNPASPFSSPYVYNSMFAGNREGTMQNPNTNEPLTCIMTEKLQQEALGAVLSSLREEIANFKNREKRYPHSLNELFDTTFETPEPYGGIWEYNSDTGDVRASTHPQL